MRYFAAIAFLFFCSTKSNANEHRGYIVKLKDLISPQSISLFSGLGVESVIPQLNLIVTKSDPRTSEIQNLNQLVEYVEPNYIARRMGELTNLFNYRMVNAPKAWEITKGSHDVVVSVSDSGIWHYHSDLRDNLWMNPGEVGLDANGNDKSKNKIDDDGNGYVDDVYGWNFLVHGNRTVDDMYHGTHVAGTIGAVGGNKTGMTGIAWKVRIMTAKFLDRDGSGTYAGGINSILYSADNGARVINCSWGGGGYSKALEEAIEYAKSKNALVVAAAGNSGQNTDRTPAYPAAHINDNIISVASVYKKDSPLSWFSNWGVNSVDIAAPGENILSTFNPTYSPLYRHYFFELTGTSMSAPHVTGALALMLSVNPKLSWSELKDLLLKSGAKSEKLAGKIATGAVLDVAAAVEAAKNH